MTPRDSVTCDSVTCDAGTWSRGEQHCHPPSRCLITIHHTSALTVPHSEREIIKMLCSRGGMEYIPAIIHSNFLLSPSPHSTPFICSLRCEMFRADIFQIYCLHSEFSFLSINLDCSLLQRKINFKLEKVKFQS